MGTGRCERSLGDAGGSQSEEDCLDQMNWVNTTLRTQPSLPLGPELIVDDGLRFTVGHGVTELLHFAASLGESISLFVASDPTVRWYPLECNDRLF